MSEGYSDDPTPYRVVCHAGCGPVFLTQQEYESQMSKGHELWRCPRCGVKGAEWDDENYEQMAPAEDPALDRLIEERQRTAVVIDDLIASSAKADIVTENRIIAKILRVFADEVQHQQAEYRRVQSEFNTVGGILPEPVPLQLVIEAQSKAITLLRDEARRLEK